MISVHGRLSWTLTRPNYINQSISYQNQNIAISSNVAYKQIISYSRLTRPNYVDQLMQQWQRSKFRNLLPPLDGPNKSALWPLYRTNKNQIKNKQPRNGRNHQWLILNLCSPSSIAGDDSVSHQNEPLKTRAWETAPSRMTHICSVHPCRRRRSPSPAPRLDRAFRPFSLH